MGSANQSTIGYRTDANDKMNQEEDLIVDL